MTMMIKKPKEFYVLIFPLKLSANWPPLGELMPTKMPLNFPAKN